MNKLEFTTMIQAQVYGARIREEKAARDAHRAKVMLAYYEKALQAVETVDIDAIVRDYSNGYFGLEVAMAKVLGQRID